MALQKNTHRPLLRLCFFYGFISVYSCTPHCEILKEGMRLHCNQGYTVHGTVVFSLSGTVDRSSSIFLLCHFTLTLSTCSHCAAFKDCHKLYDSEYIT